MVLISVIIPAHNAAPTLTGTLTSVLGQCGLESLGADLEVIVVDDRSTDATQAIVTNCRDPRVRLQSSSGQGAAMARNDGLAIAQGDLIAFLDADDLWHPDKLASQTTQLQAHPEAAAAYSWTDYIDSTGHILYPGMRPRYEGNIYTALFEQNFIASGSNLLIRRSALDAVGNFDPSFPCVHDWELWLRLAEQFPFALVRQAHIQYRQHSGTISSNLKGQEQFSRRVINEALDRSPSQLKGHRRTSLGNLYQYLTFKSLQQGKTRRQALTSLRYLCQALIYEPQIIQKRWTLISRTIGTIGLKLLGLPHPNQRRTPAEPIVETTNATTL
jgi:glycosyltransferase involved in cell wall biosynthesis